MSRTLSGLALVIGLSLGITSSSRALGSGCYNPATFCKYLKDSNGRPTLQADTSCPKLPTTLYIANTNSSTAGDGWTAGTGLCGQNVNNHRACGDYPLTNSVCGPGVGVSTGDPFDGGDPCDPASTAFDPFNCSGHDGPYLNSTPSSKKATAVAQSLAAIAQRRLPAHVERIIDTLGNVSALHVRATFTLSSELTKDQPVAGVYEYWEKDGKYRIHFGIDLAEILVSDIAYNGGQYQMALAHSSTLTISGADERAVPSEIPNPFFLILQPLSITTSDCPDCSPRLSDLRTLRDLLQTASLRSSSSPSPDVFSKDIKVTLMPSGNLATAILSKKEVGLVERTEFSDYEPVEGLGQEFPRFINFYRTLKNNDTDTRLTIQFRIDGLEVDREIDESLFTLDRTVFKSVWSEDRQRFLKSPPCPKMSPAAQ